MSTNAKPAGLALRKWFGERLKEERHARALSQEKFADLCRVTGKTIGEIERGETNATLETIAEVLSPLGLELRLQRTTMTPPEGHITPAEGGNPLMPTPVLITALRGMALTFGAFQRFIGTVSPDAAGVAHHHEQLISMAADRLESLDRVLWPHEKDGPHETPTREAEEQP